MRAIVIFATLTAVVLARPDVSHLGYQYKQPSGGAISGQSSGNGYNTGAGFSGGNNELESLNNKNDFDKSGELSSTIQGFSSYDAPYVSGNNYAGNGYSDSASFGSSSSAVSSGAPYNGYSDQGSTGAGATGLAGNGFTSQSSGANNGFSTGSGSNGFGATGGSSNSYSSGSGSSGNGFGGSNGQAGGVNLIQGQSQSFDLTGGSNGGRVVYKPVIKQGEPIITKNFYVHAAPEEDENVRVEEKVQVVRPQKTYKIIFIKAPSAGANINAANYPIYPQNEEKTIVYVLSKKDEGISDIGEIPTPPPAVTHKPEVFFIKYKTKQEAAKAVANIQAQFQAESQGQSSAGSSAGGTSFNLGAQGDSNVIVSSSGSASDGNTFDARITPDDIRVGEDAVPVDISAFEQTGISLSGGSNGGSSGLQNFQSSSTQFGPTGQVELQTSSFGPTGGQTITHSAQIPTGNGPTVSQTSYQQTGSDGQTYTQTVGPTSSGSYSSDSTGSSAEFVPQNIIQIPAGQSVFKQSYLPPNRRY